VAGSLLVALILFALVALVTAVPLVARQVADLAGNTGRYAKTAVAFAEGEHAPEFVRDLVDRAQAMFGAGGDAPVDSDADAAEPAQTDGGAAAAPEVPEAVAEAGSAPPSQIDEAAVRAIVAEEMARRQGPTAGAGGEIGGKILGAGKAVLRFVIGVVGGVVSFGFGLFLVGFFFFVFSTGWPAVQDFLRSLLPAKHKDEALRLAGKMDAAVSGFVRGRLTIAALLGLWHAIGWSLCGVPYGLVLGLMVGVFTLVPYLAGAGLLLAYGLLVIELYGDLDQTSFYLADGAVVWWKVVLFPGIVYGLAQLLDDYLLTPLIQGKATNLSMAAILVAVLAGGALAGIYGMLLAIPAAACVKILLTDVLWPRVQEWLAGEREDPLPLG